MNGLRKLFRVLLIFAALIVVVGQTNAQDSLGIEMLDSRSSLDAFLDVATIGDYLLVAAGISGLLVVSDADGDNPQIEVQLGENREFLNTVLVQGNKVLTCGEDFTIYNFTTPLNPYQLGRASAAAFPSNDNIIWHDSLLIVQSFGIQIFQQYSDASRRLLSSIQFREGNGRYIVKLALWDNKIFVVHNEIDVGTNIYAWDISNPEEPEEIIMPDQFDIEGVPLEMIIDDGIMFVTHDSTLSIIDVNTPESAELLTTWSVEGNRVLRWPVVKDDHLFLRSYLPHTLLSLEFDENYDITLADSLRINWGGNLWLDEDIIFWAAGADGLISVDIESPDNLAEPVEWDIVDRYRSGAKIGTSLLINNGEHGPYVFNNRLPEELPLIGTFLPEGQLEGNVLTSGDDLAVVSWWDGENDNPLGYSTQIITASEDDPSQQVLRGIIPSNAYLFSDPFEDYIYSIGGETDSFFLEIHDISDLDNPVLSGTTEFVDASYITYIQRYNEYLYVGILQEMNDQINIYSLENPEEPELVNEMVLQWFESLGLAPIFSDNLMFMSAQNGFDIYSMADPDNPEFVASGGDSLEYTVVLDYNQGNLLTARHIEDQYLQSVLEVYDIADEQYSDPVAWHTLPSMSYWGYLDGSRIVTTWNTGMALLYWEDGGMGVLDQVSLPTKPQMSVYPVPTNPEARISMFLPEAGILNISVFDLLGRKIVSLAGRDLKAGSHTFQLPGN